MSIHGRGGFWSQNPLSWAYPLTTTILALLMPEICSDTVAASEVPDILKQQWREAHSFFPHYLIMQFFRNIMTSSLCMAVRDGTSSESNTIQLVISNKYCVIMTGDYVQKVVVQLTLSALRFPSNWGIVSDHTLLGLANFSFSLGQFHSTAAATKPTTTSVRSAMKWYTWDRTLDKRWMCKVAFRTTYR